MRRLALLFAAAAVAAACAPLSTAPWDDQVRREVAGAVSGSTPDAAGGEGVRETDEPYISARVVDAAQPERAGIHAELAQAPLAQALQSIAQPRGYGLSFVGNARPQARVSIAIANLPFASAVREIALAAGLVAVIDERKQQVFIAEEATYLFRIPPYLLERQSTSFSIHSSPGAPTGGAPGPATGAGSGSTGASCAQHAGGSSTVVQGSTVRSADSLLAALTAIGGGSAQRVHLLPESALVQFRGNALQLRRARDLLDLVTREGQQQIEVETAFVEVSLTRQFQYGIDWQKVMSGIGALGTGTSVQLQASGAGIVASPTLQASVTGRSVKTVINVLDNLGGARVVARPSVVTRNHADAVLYRGRQVPYLAEVSQQAVANVGTSTGARVDFVPEGTSLALHAGIVDPSHVDLRLEPTQVQGVTFQQFSFGQGAVIQAPDYPLSQAHISLLVESGKTYVIGGLGLETGTDADQRLPGLSEVPWIGRLFTSTSRAGDKSQLVLLLTARILPGPSRVDSLAGESL